MNPLFFALLLSISLFLALPLPGTLRAATLSSTPTISIVKGNPFLDVADGSIAFTLTNPASGLESISSLDVHAPGDWAITSCAPGSYLNEPCMVTRSSAGTSVAYQASNGTSLPPGASDTFVFTGTTSNTSYPFEDSFTTTLTSPATHPYQGPSFTVIVIAPSTSVTLIPGLDVDYAPGRPPISITATVTPAQQGLPIYFTAPGYQPGGVVPIFSNASAVTDSSGAATISFTPSDMSGDSTDVVASIGTSGVFGVSGTITTLAASTPGSGPTAEIILPAGVGTNSDLNFVPDNITVAPGTTIVFINKDTSVHDIDFTGLPSGVALATSPNTNEWTDDEFNVTLTAAGTYSYRCDYHSWMTGTITVVSSTTPPFEFTLSVSPSSLEVGPGQEFNASVSVGTVNDTPGMVGLSVSSPNGTRLPAEARAAGAPPFGSELTGTAPLVPGNYVFLVTGTRGDFKHSAILAISVLPPSIVLSTNSSAPGSPLVITGKDFPPGSNVSITMGPISLGKVTSTGQGTFVASFSVPHASEGDYEIAASSSSLVATRPFAVVSQGPSPLPWTEIGEVVIAAVAVAGVGGGLYAFQQSKLPPRPDDPEFTVTVTVTVNVTTGVQERRRKPQQ